MRLTCRHVQSWWCHLCYHFSAMQSIILNHPWTVVLLYSQEINTGIHRCLSSLLPPPPLQPTSSETDHLVTRDSLLATLLQLLNLSSSSQADPAPHHQLPSGPSFQYKPGDLGIVPAGRGPNAPRPSHRTPQGIKSGVVGTQLPPLVPATGSIVLGGRTR